MPYPVTVYGQQFLETDFAGLNYVQTVPDTLSKLADLNAAPRGWTSASNVAIGFFGAKTFTIAPGVVDFFDISEGAVYVRAFNSAGNYMDGVVTAYDSISGDLTISVVQAAGAGTYSSWTLVPLSRHPSVDVEKVPIGGEAGGTGRLTQESDVRLGFMKPMPGMGYLVEEEFFPGLPPYIAGQDSTDTPWIYRSDQSASITGTYASNLMGVAQVSYYSGGDAPGLALGRRGFLSPVSAGDLYFGAFVAFSTEVFSGQGSTSYFVGLRGEGSSYLRIFDKYGIGFEAILDSTDTRHWYAVVTVAGQSTRQLLLSGVAGAYCVAWVDSFAKAVYFSVVEDASNIPNPGDPSAYMFSVDLSQWPIEDPVGFVHPAASVVPNVAAGATSHVMYIDRIYLHKALER